MTNRRSMQRSLNWTLAALLVAAALLSGCASTRYLTEAQDAEMRAMCESQTGCVVVPGHVWQHVQKMLGI